jgi:hypothetical protein
MASTLSYVFASIRFKRTEMKKRSKEPVLSEISEGKGGRFVGRKTQRKRKAGRHPRVARVKPSAYCEPLAASDSSEPSALSFADGVEAKGAVEIVLALTQERERMQTEMVELRELLAGSGTAIRDALRFYDRVAGTGRGEGWSTADVLRLEEIRKMAGQ